MTQQIGNELHRRVEPNFQAPLFWETVDHFLDLASGRPLTVSTLAGILPGYNEYQPFYNTGQPEENKPLVHIRHEDKLESVRHKPVKLCVVIGATGSGQTSIVTGIVENNPSQCVQSVSVADRKPREGEVNIVYDLGDESNALQCLKSRVDDQLTTHYRDRLPGYVFTTPRAFRALADAGYFVDSTRNSWSDEHNQGNQKGTPHKSLELAMSTGKPLILGIFDFAGYDTFTRLSQAPEWAQVGVFSMGVMSEIPFVGDGSLYERMQLKRNQAEIYARMSDAAMDTILMGKRMYPLSPWGAPDVDTILQNPPVKPNEQGDFVPTPAINAAWEFLSTMLS